MTPIHASAFAFEGMGCLVVGESGSGKSRLVAQAILQGAQLIADDRVQLTAANGVLLASAPPQLAGVLELRGLGLIRMDAITHPLHLAITLDITATERLPTPDQREYLGVFLPHLRVASPPISALLLYLKAMREGRILPPDWHPVG